MCTSCKASRQGVRTPVSRPEVEQTYFLICAPLCVQKVERRSNIIDVRLAAGLLRQTLKIAPRARILLEIRSECNLSALPLTVFVSHPSFATLKSHSLCTILLFFRAYIKAKLTKQQRAQASGSFKSVHRLCQESYCRVTCVRSDVFSCARS
jgi:hypothetical protein